MKVSGCLSSHKSRLRTGRAGRLAPVGGKEIVIEDKTTTEQVKLIQQLEEEDRKAIFRIISNMVTKAKFKDFFNKNIAAL